MFLNQKSLEIQKGFNSVDTLLFQEELPNGLLFKTFEGLKE